jgi:hypothetical protein
MAQVKDSDKDSMMVHVKYDTPKVATVVADPVTDVEAPPAGKEQPLATPTASAAEENVDEHAGMGLGIALFCLILVGILSFLLPLLSIACIIAAIVIASVLTCGCCCAGNYHLRPHVKKWAMAALVTLSLTFIVSIVGIIINAIVVGGYVSAYKDVGVTEYSGAIAIEVVVLLLKCLALAFSVLFTRCRKCGAPPSLG